MQRGFDARRRREGRKSPTDKAFLRFADTVPDNTRYIWASGIVGRKARRCWPSGVRWAAIHLKTFGGDFVGPGVSLPTVSGKELRFRGQAAAHSSLKTAGVGGTADRGAIRPYDQELEDDFRHRRRDTSRHNELCRKTAFDH